MAPYPDGRTRPTFLCEDCQYWVDDMEAHAKVCLKGSMDERALEERRRNNAKQAKKGAGHDKCNSDTVS